MTELVTALGWRAGRRAEAHLLALLAAATGAALLIGAGVPALLGVGPIVFQIGVWLVWLVWLGVVFPRNATQDAERPCELPYRRAFTREILLGVAVAFSQILHPALAGLLAGVPDTSSSAANLIAGSLLVAIGFGSIVLGVAALGVARTLFVFEYVQGGRGVLRSGIYRFLRHPLFLGGTAMSLGLAICTANPTAIRLGVVNACVVPIYVWLEDRRCCTILGSAYVDYRAVVGGMVPWRRSSIIRSAPRRHATGSAGPITERKRVSRR